MQKTWKLYKHQTIEVDCLLLVAVGRSIVRTGHSTLRW